MLPSFSDLTKTLGKPDDAFEAWRNATKDEHWKSLDLSALRIGYELGKASIPKDVPGGWECVPIGEVVRMSGSQMDMQIIRWRDGYAPKLGDKLYAVPPNSHSTER